MAQYFTPGNKISRFFFANTISAWIWLVVRLYLGLEWFHAGLQKVLGGGWTGRGAGAPLLGFVQGALAKTGGMHPDVQWWYADFLRAAIVSHTALLANMVAWGELAVGVALMLGFLTGISALFGMFMNANYLLAGTVSVNPGMFFLGLLLLLSWRVSGYIGIDHFILHKVFPSLRSQLVRR